MKIYHNPRCSKSRQGLAIVQEANVDFEIREYLKERVSEDAVNDIIKSFKLISSGN